MTSRNGTHPDPSPHDRQALGRLGERLAAEFFISLGYRVLAERWRTADGEIDLIVQGENGLVFVEVKTRYDSDFGDAVGAVNALKLQRMIRVAEAFRSRYNWWGEWRLDVMGITFPHNGGPPHIDHVMDVTLY